MDALQATHLVMLSCLLVERGGTTASHGAAVVQGRLWGVILDLGCLCGRRRQQLRTCAQRSSGLGQVGAWQAAPSASNAACHHTHKLGLDVIILHNSGPAWEAWEA